MRPSPNNRFMINNTIRILQHDYRITKPSISNNVSPTNNIGQQQQQQKNLTPFLLSWSTKPIPNNVTANNNKSTITTTLIKTQIPSNNNGNNKLPITKYRTIMQQLWHTLLPYDYPHSVKTGYVQYVLFTMSGSCFGTAASVLSIQAMLSSIGVGATTGIQLPLAATLNWILKDGLGQLGGVLFASFVNTKFDSEAKRWRFKADCMLALSVILESCTGIFPTLFLPIASIANVGKNIAWLSASATRASIHQSFTLQHNLGDVTAKSGSQTIAASILGTFLGLSTSAMLVHNPWELMFAVSVLSGAHLSSSFIALTYVSLNTLNPSRGVMAMEEIIQQQLEKQSSEGDAAMVKDSVLTPIQVGRKEMFMLFPQFFNKFWNNSKENIMIRVGIPLDGFAQHDDDIRNALEFAWKNKQPYIMSPIRNRQHRLHKINLIFFDEANSNQVIHGFLEACLYFRLEQQQQQQQQQVHDDQNLKVSRRDLARKYANEINMKYDMNQILQEKGWDMNHLFIEEYHGRIIIINDDGNYLK
jgi:hypothetical protein